MIFWLLIHIDNSNPLEDELVQVICIHQHLSQQQARTPANQDVPPEVLPLREEGNS